ALVLRQYEVDEAGRICAVEAALLARLRGAAPVPALIAADPAGTAAGEPVLLTRFVPGVPLSAALAGPGDHAALGRAAGRALAAIGADGSVAAVLDWEFAFSGSPLNDVGNMLRFEQPPGFAAGFADGFRDGGGELPPDWREISAALDLAALADLLTRPAGHRYFGKAVSAVRARLARPA